MNLSRIYNLLEGTSLDGVDCNTVRPEFGNGNAIEAESGLLLYAMVHRVDPVIVVETGTHWGFSSACIASALAEKEHDYPKGRRLHTIDVNDYERRPERLWSAINVEHVISRYIADTRTSVGTIVPSNLTIDFLWLDADHSAEAVITEWERFAPMLNRKRALIGFHDTRLDVRESEGIKQILQSHLSPMNEYKFTSYLPLRNMRGMDFILLSNEELGW